jgi:hypothetical protein
MESGDIFLISAIGIFIGLVMIATGFWRYLVVQKLQNTPLSKVSSVAVGLVALSGTARLHEKQNSPISNVPSAFWRIVCSSHKDERNGGWEGFYTAQSKSIFILDDGTGTIPVVPEGATFQFPTNLSFEGSIVERGAVLKQSATMDPRVLKFIESLDPETQEEFQRHKSRNLMVNEYVIRENDPLFILGSVMPADGVPGIENQETLVVRQAPNETTMFISDSSEREFINTMTGHMYLQIILGLALAGICVFFLQAGGGN